LQARAGGSTAVRQVARFIEQQSQERPVGRAQVYPSRTTRSKTEPMHDGTIDIRTGSRGTLVDVIPVR
jgi:hypothetical protein